MENDIIKTLEGKLVVIGIGNILRGDDGAGPALVKTVQERLEKSNVRHPDLVLIDAGEAPENHLGKVVALDPDTVLLVDAADFKASPGTARLIRPDTIDLSGLSTHNASLKLSLDFLKAQSRAEIQLVGIQKKNIRLGEAISEPVRNTIRQIAESLVALALKQGKGVMERPDHA